MKSLNKLLEIHLEDHQQKTAAIYTDSLITLQSIANVNNYNFLVEKIREKIRTLESCNWKLELSWIKAHLGILRNELADSTAKEAAQDVELQEYYSKIPISAAAREVRERYVPEWEQEWVTSTKGSAAKSLFPSET